MPTAPGRRRSASMGSVVLPEVSIENTVPPILPVVTRCPRAGAETGKVERVVRPRGNEMVSPLVPYEDLGGFQYRGELGVELRESRVGATRPRVGERGPDGVERSFGHH